MQFCVITGNRDKAKLLLRKKKFQEGLIDKTESQLEKIEQLVSLHLLLIISIFPVFVKKPA